MKLRCQIGLHKWDFSIHEDRIFRMCRKCGSMYCWSGSAAGTYPEGYKLDHWVLLFKDASQCLSGRGQADLKVLAIKPAKSFNYYSEQELGLHHIRN
jgi:hypothetical protein